MLRKSAILILALCFFASCSVSRKMQLESKGGDLVVRIENYRKTHNRLPDSLNDLGIKETEGGPLYYQKKSDERYIIWFGMDLGESVTYDSATLKWDK